MVTSAKRGEGVHRSVALRRISIPRNDYHPTARDVTGWDSFKMLEIIIPAEERFGIQMGTSDLDQLKNVGELAGSILSKLG